MTGIDRRPAPAIRYGLCLASISLVLTLLVGNGAIDSTPLPAMAATSNATSDYDWPTLAHDPRRSGSTAVGPVGPFTKIWYRDFWSELGEEIASGYQPVVVHDAARNKDLVYVGTAHGALYALDMNGGTTYWRYPAPGQRIGGILNSPTVAGGVVYVASLDGNVYALDGANVAGGSPALKWAFRTGRQGGFWATPAVTTDTVYIGGRDGYFYALDRNSGAKRWEYYVGAPILTSPAYDGGVVYFGAEDMHGYALDASTGGLRWQSARLAGQSMRGYYPVLTDNLVMFRTAPNDDPHKLLAEGEQVLAFGAGCSSYPAKPSYDRSNAPCFDWKAAASSQDDYDRERQAVIAYLSGAGYNGLPGRPDYETFHTLRRADGGKPYVSPVLYTAGNGEPGVPPVVAPNGGVWTLYRSYFSDYDSPSWFIMLAFGQMDVSTGAIAIRNPNPSPTGYQCDNYSCNPAFGTNVWMIGDETTAFSIAGNVLYTNQWSGLGTVDLATGDLRSVIGRRDGFADALLSDAPRSLAFGELPRLGSTYNGPPIFGDKIVAQYSSVVAVMQGQLPGGTPPPATTFTPQPRRPFSATTAPAVAIPSQADLERYVWEAPAVLGRDAAGSADLVAALQGEVSDLLQSGRLAPWFLTPGKNYPYIYFVDPAQTAYYLALAYPYLTPSQQIQVKSFVANEWASISPLSGQYDWEDGLTYSNGQVIQTEGRRREPFPVGPYDYCKVKGGCEGWRGGSSGFLMIREPFDRLYDIWSYSQATGDWIWLQANWGAIKGTKSVVDTTTDAGLLGLSTDPAKPSSWAFTDSANRRLAALIAYTRLANQVNDRAEVDWGLNGATLAMQARLRYVNAFRPTDGDGRDQSTSTWEISAGGNDGGLFVQRYGAHFSYIPQYRELVPEVARLLYDYAPADVQRYEAFINVNKPVLYLQRGPNSLRGEVMYPFPSNIQGTFLAKALLSRLPGDALREYLDIPWVRQDYYYWERLARTVDAYGQPAVLDVRTPGGTPTPTPTPTRPAGQLYEVYLAPVLK